MSDPTFSPDWASPPGETIAHLLEERGMTVQEFARDLGGTVSTATALITGRIELTTDLAQRIASVLGASPAFWVTREAQYRHDVQRLSVSAELLDPATWLQEMPLADMVKFGWIPRPKRGQEVEACLKFFGTPNLETWKAKYDDVMRSAALRTSPTLESNPTAVAAWLRQGEIKSREIALETWNPQHFRSSLPAIRALTRKKKPTSFLPDLVRICAASGVATVVVRAPSGCRASGATKFVSKEHALLLVSFRHRSDDHFWFTFFHEAGHLILHSERATFVEGLGVSTPEEEEANMFAASALIPPEFQKALDGLRLDLRSIAEFAKHVGVSPGIVIGQLHHRRRIQRNHWNKLRVFYRWEEIQR